MQPAVIRNEKPAALKKLKPLPAVAIRLMQLVSTDEVVFRRVAELIRIDAAFSAEVLRVANSALLGRRERVFGILHAVAILGLERLKSLVMMVALRNFLATALEHPPLLRCWRHSLACAVLSEEIAGLCWMDRDKAYTVGLLHDIGRLALLGTYPEDYAQLLETVDRGEADDVLECERAMFGVDHCEAGRWLAVEWELPAEYPDILARHHDPVRGKFDLLALVKAACLLADALGFQAAGPAPLVTVGDLGFLPEGVRGKLSPDDSLMLAIASRINAIECSLLT